MAQVVERYFREVEAASSSLVTPIAEYPTNAEYSVCGTFFVKPEPYKNFQTWCKGKQCLFKILRIGCNKVN